MGTPSDEVAIAHQQLASAVADLAQDLGQVAGVLGSVLVTDAVDRAEGPVTLRVRRGGDTLAVEVVDHTSQAEVVHERLLTSLGSRTLQLVDAAADAWSSAGAGQRGVRSVWLELPS